MDKQAKIASISALVFATLVIAIMVAAAPKKCNNGADDDNDGLTDYPADPGCTSSGDNNERQAGGAQCDDGIDNGDSEDTIADYPADVGCSSAFDTDERNQCNDAADNDGDTHTDYAGGLGDSKCSSAADNDESPRDSCSDTDGGFSVTVAGIVSGDDESSPYSFADVCLDAVTLREFQCGTVLQDYAPLNTSYNCSGNFTGCSAGACV